MPAITTPRNLIDDATLPGFPDVDRADAKMMKLARDYAIYRMYDGKGPNGERILVHDSPPQGNLRRLLR